MLDLEDILLVYVDDVVEFLRKLLQLLGFVIDDGLFDNALLF